MIIKLLVPACPDQLQSIEPRSPADYPCAIEWRRWISLWRAGTATCRSFQNSSRIARPSRWMTTSTNSLLKILYCFSKMSVYFVRNNSKLIIFALVSLYILYTCPEPCTVFTESFKEYIQFRSCDMFLQVTRHFYSKAQSRDLPIYLFRKLSNNHSTTTLWVQSPRKSQWECLPPPLCYPSL